MDQNNNSPKKTPNRDEAASKIIRFFSIILAVAIVSFCYALTRLENGFFRMIIFVLSAIFGLFSIFTIVVMILGSTIEENGRNFFLYDAKKKKEISPDELTLSSVRERLLRYMSSFKVHGRLYIGDLFDEKQHVPEHFKPLFCYELLHQIADDHADAELLLSFGLECAETFSKYLNQNKDYDLALDIKLFFIDFSTGKKKGEDFKRYVTAKKAHIEEKMMSYTKENIEKFI
jgi:hypothetical protein